MTDSRKKGFLLICLMMLFGFLYSADNIILEIKVQGNNTITTEMIRSVINFEVGDFLAPNKISDSIKSLYKLGAFKDVSVDAIPRGAGLSIIINVVENPIVDKVEITGNKKIKDKAIKDIIPIKSGIYFAPFLESETTKKIVEEYRKKSHNFATVDYKTEFTEDKVNITVKVTEGEKIAIKKITFNGNIEIPSKTLLRKIKTKKASILRSGKFESEKFEEDFERLIKYYNKIGFIDARIISHEVNTKGKDMFIDIYLYEGTRYHFGNVEVSGNTKFTRDAIISKFKFKDNEIFNLEKFNRQLSDVSSLYYEEGYIYAQFDQELRKSDDIIDIFLTIEEGVRAKVREIHIAGNRKTKEKIIRRKLAIAPGDYFKQSGIIQTQRNIYNMGFFEPDMKLDFPAINKNGDIDVRIDLIDKTSGTANAGVGYNKSDNFVGTLSLSHNNLLGNAWSTSLNWEFGGKTQNVELGFTNPYLWDSNTLAGFNIYHTKRVYSTFDYQIYTNGASLRIGRPIDFINFGNIVGQYSLFAKKYEVTSWNDEISDNLARLDSLKWQYNSAYSITISRDSRDNVFFPSSGSQILLYSELAGGPFGGDFDYFKQIAQVSWYTKTFWKLVLKTKWRFGYVKAYGDTKEVPPDETFILGGTGPDGIRGYADRSIGPGDSPTSIGGTRSIIFSTEYAMPLVGDQIIALLFFDAGNCYNKLEYFNFWKMKKGGGTGLRIRSPLGIIGFDYAYNFDRDRWEPHFQFGTSF
ncbi:MAG: outer membrane protein assembly factor BamA [Candidatus Cloacimonetes bacterium]|nr:outer membrane protein assembly factor BamA [Candidatus Cloacimonadota bacterium]